MTTSKGTKTKHSYVLAWTPSYLLNVIPNSYSPHLLIQCHGLNKPQLLLVLSNHLSSADTSLVFHHLSCNHQQPTSHASTPQNMCISHQIPELSHPRFLHLVFHRSHSQLVSDILILNPISPSKPTHPSQHPNLRHLHFLNVGVLD